MRNLFLLLTLALSSPFLYAHELDDVLEAPAVTPDQIEKAKDLPQTVIIRTSKSDPTKVEVVHLKDKIPPGTKLKNLKFEQMALNAEVPGIAFSSSDEKDMASSTSAWFFGFGRGYYGGFRPYAGYGYGGGYGYGYRPYYGGYGFRAAIYRPYYPSYGYAAAPYYGGGGGCCGGMPAYNPCYSYGGYNYGYQPYYGYQTANYGYGYYGWPGGGGYGGGYGGYGGGYGGGGYGGYGY